MKGIIILALCFLAGCGAIPTLEQLEAQALVTGDWSLVEQRENAIERRKLRNGPDCPAGYIVYCETWADTRCTCVARDAVIWSINY